MSKKDFEEYWDKRDALIVDLVNRVRLARATSHMEGFTKSMLKDMSNLALGLIEKDSRAHRCMVYTADILTREESATGPKPPPEGEPENSYFATATGATSLLRYGKEVSLRIYDMLEELGI